MCDGNGRNGAPEEPKWRVTIDGGFWPRDDGGTSGAEIPVGQTFTWGGNVWHVPAVYACAEGLVADLCMEVDPAAIRAFMKRWQLEEREDGPRSPEERERMAADNPLNMDFDATAVVDGEALRRERGSGMGWVPPACRPEAYWGEDSRMDRGALRLMERYGLDPGRGWAFFRESFPWADGQAAELKRLCLRLTQRPKAVPGPRFTVSGEGERVPFIYPATGEGHTLTVAEYQEQEMDPAGLPEGWEYPTHYTAMSYVVEPELPWDSLMVRDCGEGDRPWIKAPGPAGPGPACAIGVIAGEDGPTAVRLAYGKSGHPGGASTVCSALRFQPPERVEWRLVFYEKTLDDVEVELPLC